MFAKSKLTTSPSSKATPTHKLSPQGHYLPREPTGLTRKHFPRERSQESADYAATRERLDYRRRNHTENKLSRHSAVTLNPRSKTNTAYLRAHSHAHGHAQLARSLERPEESRQERLLVMREERLGKIREGFALKNRMGGQRKVHGAVAGNARFNSLEQLQQHPPLPAHNVPRFFDFCESNRYREPANPNTSLTEGVLPRSLGKDRSMKKFTHSPPLPPVTLALTPQANFDSVIGSYRPFLEIFQQSKEHFAIRRMERGFYFGELRGDTFEGRGIIFYHNGKVFEGHFAGGFKEGLGYERYPDGSSYLGSFAGNKREGRGRFEWSNGEVYDGEWRGGRKEGSGMWKGQEEACYVGEWHCDTIEGFGVLSEKGTRYEGEFRGFVKCGNGTMRWESGETYSGAFRQNMPNGQGDYYWPNGDNYQGEFVNGRRHGQGVLRLANGAVYRGQFKNDKRSGQGEDFSADGVLYEGQFENDLRHGWGRLSRGAAILFEGYWVNSKQLGPQRPAFEAIAEEESVYERDPSHASIGKTGSTASIIRQRFASRKLARHSLSKDRSEEGLPPRPFRRACNCQRHRSQAFP